MLIYLDLEYLSPWWTACPPLTPLYPDSGLCVISTALVAASSRRGPRGRPVPSSAAPPAPGTGGQ